MKVGVLGSGDVGRSLGRGFVRHGHEAMLGSRTPAKLNDWVEEVGERGSAGDFAEAAAYGEVGVLACAGSAVEDVLELAGPERLAGKVLIDATNPLRMVDGRPELFVGHTDSLGERVQRLVPDARVVFRVTSAIRVCQRSATAPLCRCKGSLGAPRRCEPRATGRYVS
jgi:8-hydroxy-5-deazaflavin:NADPH oxidoreductase